MTDITGYIEQLNTAIYGEEVRGALVAISEELDARTRGGGSDSEFFFAEYGMTPYSDMLNARHANKAILLKRNGSFYFAITPPSTQTGKVVFAGLVSPADTIETVTCTSKDVWSYSQVNYATKTWVTQQINAAVTSAIGGSY